MMKRLSVLLRRLFRKLHLWVGVAVAIPFLVITISGCLLGFGPEIDRALHPALFPAPAIGSNTTISAQTILDQARTQSGPPVMSLQPPTSDHTSWIIAQGSGKGHSMGVQWETFLDPTDGHMLGRRITDDDFVRLLHRIHNAFLLEDGRQWVGIVGLIMAGMIVTGLILLLPPPQGWKRVFIPRSGTRGTRWLLDWHSALSLWFLPLILVVTLTGITMEFPQTSRALVGENGGGHGMMMRSAILPPEQPFAITADMALEIARASHPDREVISLTPAGQGRPNWSITLRPLNGGWQGRSMTMVDAETGMWHDMPPTSITGLYFSQQHGLHGGAVLGFWGRMVIFTSGLTLLYLSVSGIVVWYRKRSASPKIVLSSLSAKEC